MYKMTEQAIINFIDPHEGNAAAIIRTDQNARAVGVALSAQSDGDTEVFMPIPDAERFVQLLIQTINKVKGSLEDTR
jgi:hypothetical protein